MFLHRPATRSVWFVPWVWLLGGALFTALAAVACADALRSPARSAAPLLVLAMALLCWGIGLLQFRSLRTLPDALVVRSLRGTQRLPIAEVALGFRVRGSSRSVRTELYATGGGEPVVIGQGMLTARQAQVHVAKLVSTLQLGAGSPRAQRLCAEDAAPMLQTQAMVDAHYQSPRWRRTGLILLAILVLYLLIMVPIMLGSETHPRP